LLGLGQAALELRSGARPLGELTQQAIALLTERGELARPLRQLPLELRRARLELRHMAARQPELGREPAGDLVQLILGSRPGGLPLGDLGLVRGAYRPELLRVRLLGDARCLRLLLEELALPRREPRREVLLRGLERPCVLLRLRRER